MQLRLIVLSGIPLTAPHAQPAFERGITNTFRAVRTTEALYLLRAIEASDDTTKGTGARQYHCVQLAPRFCIPPASESSATRHL